MGPKGPGASLGIGDGGRFVEGLPSRGAPNGVLMNEPNPVLYLGEYPCEAPLENAAGTIPEGTPRLDHQRCYRSGTAGSLLP